MASHVWCSYGLRWQFLGDLEFVWYIFIGNIKGNKKHRLLVELYSFLWYIDLQLSLFYFWKKDLFKLMLLFL